jgi:hypothetical protein
LIESFEWQKYRGRESQRASRLRQTDQELAKLGAELRYATSASLRSSLLRQEREARAERDALRRRRQLEARARSVAARVGAVAKRAERDLVRDILERERPVINALYQRLRPHPVFNRLELDFGKWRERGEVYFLAKTASAEAHISTTFSSAQVNAVAVCYSCR